MRRVLHLIETSGPGGAEKMLVSLVENPNPRKYRSVVCLLKDEWLNAPLCRRGFETVLFPQRKGLDPGWIYKCAKLVRQRRIDVLHAHEFNMNMYSCMASWFANVPSIATVHGRGYYVDRWRKRLAYRVVGRVAFKMVAVSDEIENFLRNRVGVWSDRLMTIYNGIDAKRFAPSEDGRKLRQELGIAEHVPATLQALDIFVLPSRSESLPLSLLEAMAASKPAVAISVGRNLEVIVDGETGFLVPAKDAASLAEKLMILLGDKQKMNLFGGKSYQRVHEQFLIDHMGASYERLYDAAA